MKADLPLLGSIVTTWETPELSLWEPQEKKHSHQGLQLKQVLGGLFIIQCRVSHLRGWNLTVGQWVSPSQLIWGMQIAMKCISKIRSNESHLFQDHHISAVELHLNDHQLDADSWSPHRLPGQNLQMETDNRSENSSGWQLSFEAVPVVPVGPSLSGTEEPSDEFQKNHETHELFYFFFPCF